ncbi:MAG: SRPBCC domain-containing protein [Sphingopyxis sp.]
MSDLPTYVLEKTFNAPRHLVWRTWTEPELLARWYGPNVETIVHKLDVRPGGLWLNEMKMGRGSFYQRTEFTEVIEPERIVCLMSDADAEWKHSPNPMMPDWPRELLTVVTFQEEGEKTLMRLTWAPHNASETEIACFAASISNMGNGWTSGMDILADILDELQALH